MNANKIYIKLVMPYFQQSITHDIIQSKHFCIYVGKRNDWLVILKYPLPEIRTVASFL